jgi:leucyl aminopeptidase
MDFSTVANLEKRKPSELIVLPFWKGKKSAESAATLGKLSSLVNAPLETGDFKGKEGEVLFLYGTEKSDKRIALVGLGESEKVTTEKLRRAYANITKECHKRKIQEISILVPSHSALSDDLVMRGIVEGLLIPNYAFTKHKHDSIKEEQPVLLKHVTFIGVDPSKAEIARKGDTVLEGVYMARDLINTNADEVTPQHLAKVAQGLAKTLSNVKTTVLGRKQIEKEKMDLILAVSRGSAHDPAFIIVEYKGAPKSKDHTVIVGKGVTYDTGGLNLKPTGSMETMKCDMSGAAAALGTIYAVASLGLKVNVTAVIPSVENAISALSYKPGDVYSSYAGKTVEIGNTDAEGRLILADALAYTVQNLKPDRIIDFATLTGAIEIALGHEAAGLMSNNDALADSLIRAGSETHERVWRLPLYEEYREQLKSEIADIKNIGGRPAGSITAAMFLQEFVGKTPWAHLDIASTAYAGEGPRRYNPRFGIGMGVRLMVEFLEHQM